MRIKPNIFIKHKRFMDVCVEVKKCYDYGHGIKIVGIWWNLGQVKSYRIGYKAFFNIAKIKIDNKRRTILSDWERVELK